MVKLTGSFKINRKIGEMIEIVNTVKMVESYDFIPSNTFTVYVNKVERYTLVPCNMIKITKEDIFINSKELQKRAWFFKK